MNRICEPTVSVFENGLVINYKKVGTRFFRTVSSGGLVECDLDNKQLDFIISDIPIVDKDNFTRNIINYKFSNRYITTHWHTQDYMISTYPKWKDDDSFLEDMGVGSYTEFFFENKKDVIFVIRNPIERFFSGVVQCANGYFLTIEPNSEEHNFFKEVTEFSNDTISVIFDAYKNTQTPDEYIIDKLPKEIILKLYKYLLERRWHLFTTDIHTNLYISSFIELMHNIKDSSKIKIVELTHFRSEKSINFISNLYENKSKGLFGENISNIIRNLHIETNSKVTSMLMKFNNDGQFIMNSPGKTINFIQEHLMKEYALYKELRRSSHFINLED